MNDLHPDTWFIVVVVAFALALVWVSAWIGVFS